MSMLLAPYNTSMRIGQGFNSYTQQNCVNDAVVVDPNEGKGGGDQFGVHDGTETSQIVTYCTRYVNKISDVTDAMNISASLSVKAGAVGGSANGSYVDSHTFKESNLNFFVQVKVTNQTVMAKDVLKFSPIPGISPDRFTETYGDCFVSGFIEGGELDAVISIKESNDAKLNSIKAGIEACFGGGKAAVAADFGKTSAYSHDSSETTITINWNGGGKIKEEADLWSIGSLTAAAAKFPDRVAKTPQRIYAILTKYTALRSFQETMAGFKPLQYENASIYSNSLLDMYMDYKTLWKQLSADTVDFEFDRIRLQSTEVVEAKSEPRHRNVFEELAKELADSRSIAIEDAKGRLEKIFEEGGGQLGTKPLNTASRPYRPTLEGLDQAKRDCRRSMMKIVNEVDAVTLDPTIAEQEDRDLGVMNPALFRKLLPKRTEIPKPSAPAPAPIPIHHLYQSSIPLPSRFIGWEANHSKLPEAVDIEMSEYGGDLSSHEPKIIFDSWREIKSTRMVQKIEVWAEDEFLKAIKLTYNDGAGWHHPEKLPTSVADPTSGTYTLPVGDKITEITFHSGVIEGRFSTSVITHIHIETLLGNSKDLGYIKPSTKITDQRKVVTKAKNDWSFKGFWGESGDAIDRLGAFYGKS